MKLNVTRLSTGVMRWVTFPVILFLILCACMPLHSAGNADWMVANWGVRVVLPAGDSERVADFDPVKLINQLATLKTPKWVMVNVTQGAYGGYFTTPISELEDSVHESMAPSRDLLGEVVQLLKAEGFKVIVYFAAEGPAARNLDRFAANLPKSRQRLKEQVQGIRKSWKRFLIDKALTNEEATAQHILKPFAVAFGSKIDGWWFDHGKWGDAETYSAAVRNGNPDVAIAWNEKHKILRFRESEAFLTKTVWGLARSNRFEDYTAGHVTPTKKMPPWANANNIVIGQVEKAADESAGLIDGLIPHWFIPLQRMWRGGDPDFPADRVSDWTKRMIKAGGAITWAIALAPPEFSHSVLGRHQYEQLLALDAHLLKEAIVVPR